MVGAEKWRYGIVLDAGSSGTRSYVYRWLHNDLAREDATSLEKLPVIETKDKWTKKVHVGLSTYGETPQLIGHDHLKPLIDDALKYVPTSLVSETPVFLLATAGMRLLPTLQQKNVLNAVCNYFQDETDLLIPDCDLHVQIIPGQTEGLYGWIAANYLVGGFDSPSSHDHGQGHHTYGFLDMGGASAQIAFAPNTTEAQRHADNLTLLRLRSIGGATQEHRVFVTTWLGFGVNEARKHYLEALISSYPTSTIEYPEPCLPSGVKSTLHSDAIITNPGDEPYLLGTGNFDSCLRTTLPLLNLSAPCNDDPCLFGQHVPLIDFDVNHFIGISQYWHTTHEIFEMGFGEQPFDLGTYQSRVNDFCSLPWQEIADAVEEHKYGKKISEQSATEVCFKASWLISILHDGLGIETNVDKINESPKNGTADLLDGAKDKSFLNPFTAVDTIGDTEVSWTLGKILLYASSTVPPPAPESLAALNYLPVGFGSNNGKDIPSDWTYPSINATLTPYTASQGGITGKIPFIKSDSQHRIPGFIFFLLILLIAIYALRNRISARLFGATPPQGRFAHIYNKPQPPSLLSRIPIFGRLFTTHAYARVNLNDVDMEANQPLTDPSDFEMGDWDDEDNDTKDEGRLNPLRKAKADKPPGGRSPAMDRRGLVVRTESRERLSIGPNGTRNKNSRNGSPTRLKRDQDME